MRGIDQQNLHHQQLPQALGTLKGVSLITGDQVFVSDIRILVLLPPGFTTVQTLEAGWRPDVFGIPTAISVDKSDSQYLITRTCTHECYWVLYRALPTPSGGAYWSNSIEY